jgi:hypothetical protein
VPRYTESPEGKFSRKLKNQTEVFRKRTSVLKNSLVPFSDPSSGAENPGFVVFWPGFLRVLVLFWTTNRSDNDFFNGLVRF